MFELVLLEDKTPTLGLSFSIPDLLYDAFLAVQINKLGLVSSHFPKIVILEADEGAKWKYSMIPEIRAL